MLKTNQLKTNQLKQIIKGDKKLMRNLFLQKKKALLSALIAIVMVAVSVMVATNVISPAIANAATEPTISKKTRNILVGKKYNLNINNKIKKSTYKWTSSDEKIATVDNRGIVTAKSKGKVDITCKITTPDKTVYKERCKVTVRQPADYFVIKNKVSALNLGQVYDLNRALSPVSSNDKTTWTTSDDSIAKPDSMGLFTALKEGKVTITGTTMSGESDSVTINVVDKEGIVTNQEELDALVGSGAQLITIKTDEDVRFLINKITNKDQTLVVDAPNATVENRSEFKAIEIINIKANTWYEKTVGNYIKILGKDIGVDIASNASVTIEVNEDDVKLRINNNGKIEELIVNKKATIEMTGNTEEEAPVVVNVPNIKIITSVPLNLLSKAGFELEVLPGGENTIVRAESKDFVPVIRGNTSIKVIVDDKEDTVDGIPIPTTTPSYGGGGGYNPGPDTDPTPTPEAGVYKLEKNLDQLASVNVNYVPLGIEYKVSTEILNVLVDFLNDVDNTVSKWKATTDTPKTYGGIEVKVSGTAGETSKKVEFLNSLLAGRSYDVTVNSDVNSVKLVGSSRDFTVTKLDDRSIQISPAPLASELEFTFTYK